MTCFSAPAIAAPIIVRSVIKNGFDTKLLLVLISQHVFVFRLIPSIFQVFSCHGANEELKLELEAYQAP